MSFYGSEIMCKKLNDLSGLKAEEILLLYGDTSYPVDIQKILNKLGIKSAPMNFSQIEKINPHVIKNRGEILGAVTLIDDDVFIFYNENSTSNRIRFTLAHELAHCCLNAESLENRGHIEFRYDFESSDYKEQAANIFAGKLLIPDDLLFKMYEEMIVPASDVMAKEFQVSVNVMEARLKYLGLDFYSRQNV